MLQIRKILVPIDFSERAAAAARHAVMVARRFESKLIFAHFIPPAPLEYAGFEGAYFTARLAPANEETVAHFVAQMDRLAQQVAPGLGVQKVAAEGDPAHEIVRFANENAVDLVVMPTHGYGPFRRFILGSVTAKVLHDIDCAVMTGTHVAEAPVAEVRPYERVACAIDLNEHGRKVLEWAADFAARYGASLAVIHAAPAMHAGGEAAEHLGVEYRAAVVQSATEKLGKLLRAAGRQAEIHVDSASVIEYVPKAVTQARADLLVIGRSLKEGLLGRLREHAYALIRESPCPVVGV